MSYHIEEIDIGATMNNLFTKIKRNVFYYSKLFEELAVNDQSEKFFRYKATINNVSSNIILQNNDLTIDLIFDIGGTSITWLSVQTSTIPNSGKGCFLPFDGKEGQLVSCFMGYQIAPENGSIYAFKNIDPRKENEQDPSFWCFAHFIQHGSLENANVVVDKKGGLRLARNVNGGLSREELFFDYNRSIKCEKCNKKMYKTEKPKKRGRQCLVLNCKYKKMILECIPCDIYMCQIHYDQKQIVRFF
jgi:hypothetical protein